MTEHMDAKTARRAMAKRAGKQPESLILDQAREYLRLKGWFVLRVQQGFGCEKGVSDLYCLRDGRSVWVEVKTATGRLSNWQLIFQAHIEDGGGEYRLVRSLEDAMDVDRQKEAT